jgi:hypothetical protein
MPLDREVRSFREDRQCEGRVRVDPVDDERTATVTRMTCNISHLDRYQCLHHSEYSPLRWVIGPFIAMSSGCLFHLRYKTPCERYMGPIRDSLVATVSTLQYTEPNRCYRDHHVYTSPTIQSSSRSLLGQYWTNLSSHLVDAVSHDVFSPFAIQTCFHLPPGSVRFVERCCC